MTASTVKSTQVAGFDLVPVSLVQGSKQGNKNRTYFGTAAIATTSLDDIGDVVLLARVPTKLRPTSMTLYNTDLDTGGTSGAISVGAYKSSDSSAISAACFSTTITTLTAANTAGVNVLFGTTGQVANVGKTVWEMAGLSSDPGGTIDIGFSITTAMTTPAAGTAALIIHGSLDS